MSISGLEEGEIAAIVVVFVSGREKPTRSQSGFFMISLRWVYEQGVSVAKSFNK
ncbi:hypothetical protein CIPAW_15G057200 [Carya illinoinensis]|uniref:Uncharacterized protein n=1 Tax=Carya illinoinensis TaxID=32201 RepID=A0A8T1NCK2_CARIL|nr:hypothetical protein CIPAW_15G057200 [Carya illinoinensis]